MPINAYINKTADGTTEHVSFHLVKQATAYRNVSNILKILTTSRLYFEFVSTSRICGFDKKYKKFDYRFSLHKVEVISE